MRQCSLLCDVHYDEVDEKAIYDIHLTHSRGANVGLGIYNERDEKSRREYNEAHKTEPDEAKKTVVPS